MMASIFRDIWYSFPVRLLLLHMRSQVLLILVWVLLVLLMTGKLANLYGYKYLLLTPEYIGHVDAYAFIWLGFSFGWLVITWNLTCYLIHAYRFPFLASLSRPFTRFVQNNAIIPLVFCIWYLIISVRMQALAELLDGKQIANNLLGFLFGIGLIILLSEIFFRFMNVDIDYMDRKGIRPMMRNQPLAPGVPEGDVDQVKYGVFSIRVDTYLGNWMDPKVVRSVSHYNSAYMLHIYRQNHRNAVLWLSLGVFSVFLSGWLVRYPALRAPAGASMFLLSGILVAAIGAFTYWLHRWRYPAMIALLVLINTLSSWDVIEYRNKLFRLDYNHPVEYSHKTMQAISSPDIVKADSLATIAMLENWKRKTGKSKPPMILINASGGGLRSALWVVKVLGEAEQATQGDLLKHSVLMTGASGGMIGLGYVQSLMHRQLQGQPYVLSDTMHTSIISEDLLNSIAYSMVTRDIFIPLSSCKEAGNKYIKDRSYYFEQQLEQLNNGIFYRTIGATHDAEQAGQLPLLLMQPMITDDGRRLLISSMGVSYLMRPTSKTQQNDFFEIDAVDFRGMFGACRADSLRLSTALRLNASFPYILPAASLPTVPRRSVMDAGLRDNYGTETTSRFIHKFTDWIKANTSTVVLVQINGWDKVEEIEDGYKGILSEMLNPLNATIHSIEAQDFVQDDHLSLVSDHLMPLNLQVVRFVYRPRKGTSRASVTFHLTTSEKLDIKAAIQYSDNREGLKRLSRLFN
jgi:hypothetical protein